MHTNSPPEIQIRYLKPQKTAMQIMTTLLRSDYLHMKERMALATTLLTASGKRWYLDRAVLYQAFLSSLSFPQLTIYW